MCGALAAHPEQPMDRNSLQGRSHASRRMVPRETCDKLMGSQVSCHLACIAKVLAWHCSHSLKTRLIFDKAECLIAELFTYACAQLSWGVLYCQCHITHWACYQALLVVLLLNGEKNGHILVIKHCFLSGSSVHKDTVCEILYSQEI